MKEKEATGYRIFTDENGVCYFGNENDKIALCMSVSDQDVYWDYNVARYVLADGRSVDDLLNAPVQHRVE